MESAFFSGLSKLKVDAGKSLYDDDFSDRISHTYSPILLVIFTLVISARQYIGKPIACWVPTEFTRAQEEYAESVCWVTSTYFLNPTAVTVPENMHKRSDIRLHYYQWVPFVLLVQAFLFNVPYLIWRLFNWQSGMKLSSIMEVACDIELIKDKETRLSNVIYVASHIEDSLSIKRDHPVEQSCVLRCFNNLSKCCCVWFGKRLGNYLIVLYLITKILYIVNIIGQFALMMHFIGTNRTLYGIDILGDLLMGNSWENSSNFPRITICDFDIRKVASLHKHTVQCVLPVNMFNEKIYIFLWFWCLIVAVFSISSFLHWSFKSSMRVARVEFIKKFLKFRGMLEPGDKHRVCSFVDFYLRQDGVFILRLICNNIGEIVAAEITERLWLLYINHPHAHRWNNHALVTKEKSNRSRGTGGGTKRPVDGKRTSSGMAARQKGKSSSAAGGGNRPISTSSKNSELRHLDEDPGEVV